MLREVAVLISLAASVSAQTYTGAISGKVVDATGLPVPNAQVIVTGESTNTVFKTVTGESGDFVVNYLMPGSYRIQFSASGFKEYVESGVQLQINQQRRVDPSLQVGQVSETVEVSAAAAQVNYVSPEIGQVVDADQLITLP